MTAPSPDPVGPERRAELCRMLREFAIDAAPVTLGPATAREIADELEWVEALEAEVAALRADLANAYNELASMATMIGDHPDDGGPPVLGGGS